MAVVLISSKKHSGSTQQFPLALFPSACPLMHRVQTDSVAINQVHAGGHGADSTYALLLWP